MPEIDIEISALTAPVPLEPLDDAERVLVVPEAGPAALAQQLVERLLAGVAEGRMAEVVPEPDRLDEILVQPQRAADPARDAGRLQRVGQARPEVIVEVAIMQVSRDKTRNLGISPPTSATVALQNNTNNNSSSSNNSNSSTNTSGTANQINLNRLGNLNATDFTVTIPPAEEPYSAE